MQSKPSAFISRVENPVPLVAAEIESRFPANRTHLWKGIEDSLAQLDADQSSLIVVNIDGKENDPDYDIFRHVGKFGRNANAKLVMFIVSSKM